MLVMNRVMTMIVDDSSMAVTVCMARIPQNSRLKGGDKVRYIRDASYKYCNWWILTLISTQPCDFSGSAGLLNESALTSDLKVYKHVD